VGRRNPVARIIREPQFRKRIVRQRKGKGAYKADNQRVLNRRLDLRDGGSDSSPFLI
jgi:stalled ribosome alternative rescue factor ArfA